MYHSRLPDLIGKLQQKDNAQEDKSRPEDTKDPGSQHGYGSNPKKHNTSKWKAAEQKDVPDLTTIQGMDGNHVEQIQAPGRCREVVRLGTSRAGRPAPAGRLAWCAAVTITVIVV